jgi:hypothetical protein
MYRFSKIEGWWRRNRDASPNLFLEELRRRSTQSATRHISAGSVNSRQYPVRVAFC